LVGDTGGDDGEFLEGGDDDVLACFDRFLELSRVFVDGADDAIGLLELFDGVLELLV
jgi:hypothetical protein